MWPGTRGGKTVSLPCQWDSTINVKRDCLNNGTWDEPAYDVCNLLIPMVNNISQHECYDTAYV